MFDETRIGGFFIRQRSELTFVCQRVDDLNYRETSNGFDRLEDAQFELELQQASNWVKCFLNLIGEQNELRTS